MWNTGICSDVIEQCRTNNGLNKNINAVMKNLKHKFVPFKNLLVLQRRSVGLVAPNYPCVYVQNCVALKFCGVNMLGFFQLCLAFHSVVVDT